MKRYTVNPAQYRALEGLAYWIAEGSYTRERVGTPSAAVGETIQAIFDKCDALRISFHIQNAVIEFGRDWRRYRSEYLTNILEVLDI